MSTNEVDLMCPDRDKYPEKICPTLLLLPVDPASIVDLSVLAMATTLIVALTMGD